MSGRRARQSIHDGRHPALPTRTCLRLTTITALLLRAACGDAESIDGNRDGGPMLDGGSHPIEDAEVDPPPAPDGGVDGGFDAGFDGRPPAADPTLGVTRIIVRCRGCSDCDQDEPDGIRERAGVVALELRGDALVKTVRWTAAE